MDYSNLSKILDHPDFILALVFMTAILAAMGWCTGILIGSLGHFRMKYRHLAYYALGAVAVGLPYWIVTTSGFWSKW